MSQLLVATTLYPADPRIQESSQHHLKMTRLPYVMKHSTYAAH